MGTFSREQYSAEKQEGWTGQKDCRVSILKFNFFGVGLTVFCDISKEF